VKKNQGKKRSTLPSRKKYEEANPVVSFKVSKELYDRLQVAKEKESMSYTDILKVGLGLIEVKMRAEEEVREEGKIDGYDLAEYVYKFSFPCSVCGKPVVLDTEEKKEPLVPMLRFLIKDTTDAQSLFRNQRSGTA